MALFGRPSERDDARAAAYRDWFRRQHPFALVSLLLGVFSLSHLGTLVIDGAAAVVLGIITLRQIGRSRRADSASEPLEGGWMAWGGIVAGGGSLALAAIVYGWGR